VERTDRRPSPGTGALSRSVGGRPERGAVSAVRWKVWILCAAAIVLAGCNGASESAAPSASSALTLEVSTTEAPNESTASRDSLPPSVPTASTTERIEQMRDAVTMLTQGRLVLIGGDDNCFDEAIRGLGDQGTTTMSAFIGDPAGTVNNDPAAVEPVVAAYLGCIPPAAFRQMVVMSVLRLAEWDCVAEAWDGMLPAGAVASSLVYGQVLDDLPADTIEGLAAAAADCVPDPGFWTEDVVFQDEIQLQLADDQLNCVAARYVEVMGVEEVIRRRLLQAPLLAVPLDDEARLDLAATCGVTESGRLDLIVADVSGCIANVTRDTITASVIGCDQPHNGEVFAVHDLTSTYPTWPGIRTVVDAADSLCTSDRSLITGDTDGSGFLYIYPKRRPWEQGNHTVLCVVVHEDGGTWTGPSGLVPAMPTNITSTPPATTTPGLAAGAVEITFNDIDRVGMCISTRPGEQSGAAGRMFEVDCAAPHQLEAYDLFDLNADASSPSLDDLGPQLDSTCADAFADYVGVPYASSRLDYAYLVPDEATWNNGSHHVVCVLTGGTSTDLPAHSMAHTRV